MIQHAQAANAGLLKNFPKGYALDDEHAPHISVIGGYFYTANLDELFAAAGKVLAGEKVMSWKLKAFKYYYIPLKDIGLGGIVVEPTADLIRLQNELFEAIGKFWRPPAPAPPPPSRPRPRTLTLTRPPSTRLQRTSPTTAESITVHTSLSESAQSIT